MEFEDKANVVASVWGVEFFQFLAALAVLPWSICKKRSNSFYFSKSTKAKQLARQGIEQILFPKQTRRPLPLLLSPSLFYGSDCWVAAVQGLVLFMLLLTVLNIEVLLLVFKELVVVVLLLKVLPTVMLEFKELILVVMLFNLDLLTVFLGSMCCCSRY